MTGALLLVLAASPWSPEPAELAPLVREALVHPQGPGTMAAAAVPASKPALQLDAAEAKALGALLAPHDRGCLDGPSRAPAGVWWTDDLDGDGKPERLFSGGCSPAPFFAILRGGDAGWRLWASGRGRLLTVNRTAERIIVLSAWDGYGVARASGIAFAWIDGEGVVAKRELSVVGEQPSKLESPSLGTCTVAKKRAKLRSTPRVDDAPDESGMGFDWPGNLLQVLEPGSTGVPIAAHRGWSLCAFPEPPSAVGEGAAVVRAMKTPASLSISGRTEALLLGWLPAAKR